VIVFQEVVAVRRRFLALFILCSLTGLLLSGCDWLWPQTAGVDFDLAPASGSKPLLVDFTPILDGTVTTYAWDFGDGSTSTEAAPSHVYYTAGTYTVTLGVVYESGATAEVEKTDCIEVRSGFTSTAGKTLYWINSSTHDVKSGPLTGGTSASLFGGVWHDQGLTAGLDRLYYLKSTTSLYRGTLDGSSSSYLHYYYGNLVSLCFNPADSLVYVAVHPSYYGDGGIVRCDANGSNWEDWALEWGGTGGVMPYSLAIDPATERLYCYNMYYAYGGVQPRTTNDTASSSVAATIEWTSTDSYDPQYITTAADDCGGFAIDAGLSGGARYLYWTDVEHGRIDRCKIDGSGHVVLISGLDTPGPIAIDIRGGKLYWGDADGIHRADLDGTDQETLYPGADATALVIY